MNCIFCQEPVHEHDPKIVFSAERFITGGVSQERFTLGSVHLDCALLRWCRGTTDELIDLAQDMPGLLSASKKAHLFVVR